MIEDGRKIWTGIEVKNSIVFFKQWVVQEAPNITYQFNK